MRRLSTLTDRLLRQRITSSRSLSLEESPLKSTPPDKKSTPKPSKLSLRPCKSCPNSRETQAWFKWRRLKNQSTRSERSSKERRTSRAASSRPSSRWLLKVSLIHLPSRESSNCWDRSKVILLLPKTLRLLLKTRLKLISKPKSPPPDPTLLPTLPSSNLPKKNSSEPRNKSLTPDNTSSPENTTEPPTRLIWMRKTPHTKEPPLSLKTWLPSWPPRLPPVLKP